MKEDRGATGDDSPRGSVDEGRPHERKDEHAKRKGKTNARTSLPFEDSAAPFLLSRRAGAPSTVPVLKQKTGSPE
jgi:hypothetical protein